MGILRSGPFRAINQQGSILPAPNPCQPSHISGPSAADCHNATGLFGWYKADSLALVNGAPVSLWVDSSGSGNDMSNGTLATEPIYELVNGAPTVNFDTASKWLSNSLLSVTSADWTAHVVFRGDLGQNQFNPLITAPSIGGGWLLEPDQPVDLFSFELDSVNHPNDPITVAATCVPQVMTVVADSANSLLLLYRNGVRVASKARAIPSYATGGFGLGWILGDQSLGFGFGWVGRVMEIMLHSVAQSPATVAAVAGCLHTRWGLP